MNISDRWYEQEAVTVLELHYKTARLTGLSCTHSMDYAVHEPQELTLTHTNNTQQEDI